MAKPKPFIDEYAQVCSPFPFTTDGTFIGDEVCDNTAFIAFIDKGVAAKHVEQSCASKIGETCDYHTIPIEADLSG